MKKPIMKVSEPYWDYTEVIDYIEKKYSINTRGYTPKNGWTSEQLMNCKVGLDPYLDFWHWVIERNDHLSNGSFFVLYVDDEMSYPETPEWVKEILQLLKDEFGGE